MMTAPPTDLGPLWAGRRAAAAGDPLPLLTAGIPDAGTPIWRGMVADYGYDPAGAAWTPAHAELVAEMLREEHDADYPLLVADVLDLDVPPVPVEADTTILRLRSVAS